jgi:hypothetical protein
MSRHSLLQSDFVLAQAFALDTHCDGDDRPAMHVTNCALHSPALTAGVVVSNPQTISKAAAAIISIFMI